MADQRTAHRPAPLPFGDMAQTLPMTMMKLIEGHPKVGKRERGFSAVTVENLMVPSGDC